MSLARLPPEKRLRIVQSLSEDERNQLRYAWKFWARPNQIIPANDVDGRTAPWITWLILAGRGFGKTRTGAETIRDKVESGERGRIALIGPTAADGRDVMIEGESGILAVSRPDFMPKYEPSKRRLTWPNGAIATVYSADTPRQLRGPQHDFYWADELGAWRYDEATWSNLKLGLRLKHGLRGQRVVPQGIVTTTPIPSKLIKRLVLDSSVVLTRGSTFDNSANLAPEFITEIRKQFEGTRLGRQELYADILDDNPGALFLRTWIDRNRVRVDPKTGKPIGLPGMRRIVVAIDPAVSNNEKSDETGIVVCGLGLDGLLYVLEDLSGKYSVEGWTSKAIEAYRKWHADCIVAEVNNGGNLVEAALRTVSRNVAYKEVRASRGKVIRAEPVALMYGRNCVRHLGSLSKLEDQLCDWNPLTDDESPDRLDAVVWGLTELSGMNMPTRSRVDDSSLEDFGY